MNALYVISGLGILSLVSEVFNFRKALNYLVLLGLVVAGALLLMEWNASESYFNNMIVLYPSNRAFILLMVAVTFFWILMSWDYLSQPENQTDRTSLALFVLTGGTLMASFGNLAMLFLGIEMLSLSLYTLAGSRKNSLSSTEAAFKYFLMGSFATGFLLFGVALVYGATGSFSIQGIADKVINHSEEIPAFFNAGIILILIGLAFKISAVPFHFWAPDVYEGSPTPVTALMATVVKISGVVAFFSVLQLFIYNSSTWKLPLEILTVLTLLIPNIAAVLQNSAKRMLAYSSVGHVGFIMLAMVTLIGSYCPDCTYDQPVNTIFFYLSAYAAASLLSFSALTIIEKQMGHVSIANFKGLFKRSPFLAVSITIALLSLAGIPPLAGFFGKYMVFVLAIQHGYGFLALVAVLASLIGVYYYFRIIIAMFFQEPHGESFDISNGQKIWMFIMMASSFGLGIFADFLIR